MHDRGEHRREDARRSQRHSDEIDRDGADEVERHDRPRTPGDAHGRDKVRRIGGDEHDVRAVSGDVGPAAHGDADVGPGERRRVVDAVADHRHLAPRSPQRIDEGRFLLGKKLCSAVVDAEPGADGPRGALPVAGHHGDLQPHAFQFGDRARRAGPNGVGQDCGCAVRAVHAHVNGGALDVAGIGGVRHKRRVAGDDGAPSDSCDDSHARAVLEGVGRPCGRPALAEMLDHGLGQRVLRIGFRRRQQKQQFFFVDSGDSVDALNDGGSRRQRPRLVEDHGFDFGERLEVRAVFDERPAVCRPCDRGENGEGSSGGDSARPRHNDHGDSRRPVRGRDIGRCRSGERDVDEVGGESVGEPDDRGPRRLRLPDRFDDFAIRGFPSHPLGANFQRADQIDRSGENGVPASHVRRERLARNTRLVDGGFAGRHDAVHGDAPAGADDDDVPGLDVGQRDGNGALAFAYAHCLREEGHEIGQSVVPPLDGQVFENFGGQNEGGDDQGREPLADGRRGDDRNEHRQLHAHPGVSDIAPGFDCDRKTTCDKARDGRRREVFRRLGYAQGQQDCAKCNKECAKGVSRIDFCQ